MLCTSDSTKYQYIDFKEIPLTVDLEFTPEHIEMSEHCLACSNGEFCVAFRIVEITFMQSDDIISANSLTSDLSNNSFAADCGGSAGGGGGRDDSMAKRYDFDGIDLDLIQLDDCDANLTSTIDKIIDPSTTTNRKSSVSEYRPINIEIECKLRQLSVSNSVVSVSVSKILLLFFS